MEKNLREEYSNFDYELVKLLTNCNTDEEFYQRLCWALQRISNTLSQFTKLNLTSPPESAILYTSSEGKH